MKLMIRFDARRLVVAPLLVSIFATLAVTACAADTADKVVSNPWQEAVISVSDLDVTARFFKEIGGYKEHWRGELDASELRAFGLPKEASGEALLLGPADATSALVRLIRFDNAGRREPMRPGSRAWDSGCYFSLMIRVKDMQSIYDDAIRLGWWTETPVTDLKFGASKLKVVIYRGPDGVQVQTYERLQPPLPAAIGEFDRLTRPFNMMQIVRDRDAAYDFFTQVLGFETFYKGKPYVATEPTHSPLGIPINLTTSARYQAGIVYPVPGEFGRMEMIEMMDLEGRDYADRCHAPNLGLLAVRFPVTDIERSSALVQERGWTVDFPVSPVAISPYDTKQLFSVRTPDGAIVQFMQ